MYERTIVLKEIHFLLNHARSSVIRLYPMKLLNTLVDIQFSLLSCNVKFLFVKSYDRRAGSKMEETNFKLITISETRKG